jgi:hypothetical protein
LEVFPIVPAAAKPLWFLGAIGLVLALVLLTYVAWSARHSRVEVTDQTLRLVGDLWGRSIPLRSLDLASARVLRLDAASSYRPVSRTFGTGIPGYASGWLRLRNGEKALAYLTSSESVVHIPTSQGYSLLLSVAEPEALLRVLRDHARSSTR